VPALREARTGEPVAGGLLGKPATRKAADLLRQTHQLRAQLSVFVRTARAFHRRLNQRIPDDEVEAMRTPEANLLGTLECLIAEDFTSVFKKLDELGNLLTK
jgi:hypothetical protein